MSYSDFQIRFWNLKLGANFFSVYKDVTNLFLRLEITVIGLVTLVIGAQLVITRLNLLGKLVCRQSDVTNVERRIATFVFFLDLCVGNINARSYKCAQFFLCDLISHLVFKLFDVAITLYH